VNESASSTSNINRLTGWLMAATGLVVVVFAIASLLRDVQIYHSPLDEVDTESGLDEGFVPLYAQEDLAHAGDKAPTIASDSAAVETTPTATSLADTQNTPAPAATRPAGMPFPTPTPTQPPVYYPDRIVIPSIGLDAPVVPVSLKEVEVQGELYQQWIAPYKFAAGWHNTSAPLNVPGNTVLNGHHNLAGEVFRDLHTLQEGAQIFVYSGDQVFVYRVGLNLKLKERFQQVEVRLQNAQWILPSNDERLTLITCWPYESNTHRVVIVALPTTLDGTQQ
jgi:LPXTG-site transpeptidase (sortase) family protein